MDTNVQVFGGITPSELTDKPLESEGGEERKEGKGQGQEQKEDRKMDLVIRREP